MSRWRIIIDVFCDIIMRINIENEQYKMSYGLDNLMGLFLQITDKKTNDFVVDKNEKNTHGITFPMILRIAEEYEFVLPEESDDGLGEFRGDGCGGGCEYCQMVGK